MGSSFVGYMHRRLALVCGAMEAFFVIIYASPFTSFLFLLSFFR